MIALRSSTKASLGITMTNVISDRGSREIGEQPYDETNEPFTRIRAIFNAVNAKADWCGIFKRSDNSGGAESRGIAAPATAPKQQPT